MGVSRLGFARPEARPRRPVVGDAAAADSTGGPVGRGLSQRSLVELDAVEQLVVAAGEVPMAVDALVAVLVGDRLSCPSMLVAHLARAVHGASGVVGVDEIDHVGA